MKNLSKTSLRLFYAKKAAPKTPNNKFSKISKTSHYARAIYSLSKMVSLGQTFNQPKTCQKQLQNHIKVLLRKKRLQKPLNTRKMTSFQNSAKLATMQRGQFRSKLKIVKKILKNWPPCKGFSQNNQNTEAPKNC